MPRFVRITQPTGYGNLGRLAPGQLQEVRWCSKLNLFEGLVRTTQTVEEGGVSRHHSDPQLFPERDGTRHLEAPGTFLSRFPHRAAWVIDPLGGTLSRASLMARPASTHVHMLARLLS